MLERTRGPSIKPACAATKRMAAWVTQGYDDQNIGEIGREKAAIHFSKQAGVERLAGLRGNLIEQIAKQKSARGKGKRDGHVNHGPFPGLNSGLAQGLEAVADRFDTGVRAASKAVGMQDNKESRP